MTGTRQRLVAATNELFRRRGYNGTGLKEVTVTAEATTGSLYHFFPGGKSELAAAVITETGAAYQQLFELIADGAPGVADGVRDFFDGAAAVLAETDYVDVCPIGTVAREVASTDETLRATSGRVFAGWIDALTARLVDAGLDRPEAKDVATSVVAALEGGFILSRTARDADLLRSIGAQMHDLVAGRVATARRAGAHGDRGARPIAPGADG
jgi:AcrR family transcriptional regulator